MIVKDLIKALKLVKDKNKLVVDQDGVSVTSIDELKDLVINIDR